MRDRSRMKDVGLCSMAVAIEVESYVLFPDLSQHPLQDEAAICCRSEQNRHSGPQLCSRLDE